MTHICVSELTIIGSDNGLSPARRQAIIWINDGILLIGYLGTNFSEILIEIHTFSLKKIDLKMSSGKWRPSCLGLNVLSHSPLGDVVVIWKSNARTHVKDYAHEHFLWKCSQGHATFTLHDKWAIIYLIGWQGLIEPILPRSLSPYGVTRPQWIKSYHIYNMDIVYQNIVHAINLWASCNAHCLTVVFMDVYTAWFISRCLYRLKSRVIFLITSINIEH